MRHPSEWPSRIYHNEYEVLDDFSKRRVKISGWTHNGKCTAHTGKCKKRNHNGTFDSYISALADGMDMWEEYCEFHRIKGVK